MSNNQIQLEFDLDVENLTKKVARVLKGQSTIKCTYCDNRYTYFVTEGTYEKWACSFCISKGLTARSWHTELVSK